MSAVKTTVKTEACSFSEHRIYPGRGSKFIAKDGKVYFFLCSKFTNLSHLKKKPAKLRWTQTWRRNNKKTKVEATQRRRYKKTAKSEKGVAGFTLEDIRNRKAIVQTLEAKQKAKMAAKGMAMKEDKKKSKTEKGRSILQLEQSKNFSKIKKVQAAKTKMHKAMKK